MATFSACEYPETFRPAFGGTFRDAVVVTRRFGLRYLWIDSLCIIQDSHEDWTREAAQRATVYTHADFNISALASSDCNGGLFRLRNHAPSIEFKSPAFVKGLPRRLGVRKPLPTLDDGVEHSPIFLRGWIFQERLLSPAILHYGFNQIFYECRVCAFSEIQRDRASHEHLSSRWSVDPGRIMCRDDPMDAGYEIVQEYSRRSFTKHTDRLPAMLGIAKAFKQHMRGEFLAGLWLGNLARGFS